MKKRGKTSVDEGETVALARQPVLAATATWIKPQMCAVAPTPLTPLALHIIMESWTRFLSPAKNSFVVVKLVSRVSLLLWSCSRSGLKRPV